MAALWRLTLETKTVGHDLAPGVLNAGHLGRFRNCSPRPVPGNCGEFSGYLYIF